MIKRPRICLECGQEFHKRGKTGTTGDFCSTSCRTAFNNRRKERGVELYDLYMAHRFDRANAQELGVFQAINRLASLYRQEDNQRRAGRRSWRRPRAVLEERPYLKAIATYDGTGRGRMR
jgi:hypothetical protein